MMKSIESCKTPGDPCRCTRQHSQRSSLPLPSPWIKHSPVFFFFTMLFTNEFHFFLSFTNWFKSFNECSVTLLMSSIHNIRGFLLSLLLQLFPTCNLVLFDLCSPLGLLWCYEHIHPCSIKNVLAIYFKCKIIHHNMSVCKMGRVLDTPRRRYIAFSHCSWRKILSIIMCDWKVSWVFNPMWTQQRLGGKPRYQEQGGFFTGNIIIQYQVRMSKLDTWGQTARVLAEMCDHNVEKEFLNVAFYLM